MSKPVRSGDTERGTYELMIRATDTGIPPLYSEAKLFVRVGVPGNQKPIFRGNYKSNLPGPSTYRARLLENASPGTEVIRVVANDPDGRDNLLQYYIASGSKDNFVIDSRYNIKSTIYKRNIMLKCKASPLSFLLSFSSFHLSSLKLFYFAILTRKI